LGGWCRFHLSLQKPDQIITRKQRGILRVFKKRPDIVKHGLDIDRFQAALDQGAPQLRIADPATLTLIQRVLKQNLVRRNRRTLGKIPEQIIPIPSFRILARNGRMHFSCC